MGRINDNKQVLKDLQKLMKQAGQKYSIRVGIIGEQAAQIHPDTNLTNAELGAVHEFGATINHPGGQPYIIKDGRAVFISKGTELGRKLIAKGQVTKAHQIVIPTRSFLRSTLLSADGKNRLMTYVEGQLGGEISADKWVNEYLYGDKLNQDGFMQKIADTVGDTALNMVQEAFSEGGSPDKWKPITPYTKKHRRNDPDNPPLQDSGDLMDSITAEVKKI